MQHMRNEYQQIDKIKSYIAAMKRRKFELSTQKASMSMALEELSKMPDGKVYMIISNILFPKDVRTVEKELKLKKEFISSQLESLESGLEKALNELQTIENENHEHEHEHERSHVDTNDEEELNYMNQRLQRFV